MEEMNTNLKNELMTIIRQMEKQVGRLQDKRRLKQAEEARMLEMLESKNNKLRVGQKKFL